MKRFIILILSLPLVTNSALAQQGISYTDTTNAFYIPEEKTEQIIVGDKPVTIRSWRYGNRNDVVLINLHDNEFTSLAAAHEVVKKTGGLIIKIENKGQRVIRFNKKGIRYGFDPNRIFSPIGIEQTLRDNRRYSKDAAIEIEKFGKEILKKLSENYTCIVALHNNYDGAYSVNSYLPGGERSRDAKAVYADSLQDTDDIIFTTDSVLYSAMANRKFNSIWQDNEKAKRDGSLSIFCGENNFRYVNIETQHGRKAEYIAILEQLFIILEEEQKFRLQQKGENLKLPADSVGN